MPYGGVIEGEMTFSLLHPSLPVVDGRAGPELVRMGDWLFAANSSIRYSRPCILQGSMIELTLLVWAQVKGPGEA